MKTDIFQHQPSTFSDFCYSLAGLSNPSRNKKPEGIQSQIAALFLFRQALSGYSSQVEIANQFIRSQWEETDDSTRKLIIKEILERLIEDDRVIKFKQERLAIDPNAHVSIYRQLSDCDRSTWERTLQLILPV